MENLKEIGLADYYYLDDNKIFNKRANIYMKPVGKYRYRLVDCCGVQRSITMKEIYMKLYNKVFCIDNIVREDGEEYREITGTKGNYLVSNKGNVISYVKNTATILKPYITDKGYARVQLVIDGLRVNKFVHTLVAREWLEMPTGINPLDIEIHHLKGKAENDVNSIIYIEKSQHHKLHSKLKEKK